MKSRTSRRIEKQSKKQFYIFLIGIVVILFLTLRFGILILDGLGSLSIKLKGEKTPAQQIQKNIFLESPTLNSIVNATSSSLVNVSGKTKYDKGSIEVFLNNELHQELTPEEKKFELKNIVLLEGQNSIKVRYKDIDNKASDFSQEYLITYIKSEPKLEINSPEDGSSFSKGDQEINIQGKTEPDNKLTVNGFWSIIDGEGEFSHYLRLNEGENSIKIEATNPAGAKTTKIVNVTYSP
ncbi:hypothetical protein C4577_05445 [Candidatus Parcubacteria bacterium]|nr:MAG: hypothetical protein C4577_05445 [Candidatus Parcubacteria bacterium]